MFQLKLGKKILFSFLLIALLPFTLLSFLFYSQAKESTSNLIEENLSNLTNEAGIEIEKTIYTAYQNIIALAKNPVLSSNQSPTEAKLNEMKLTQEIYHMFEEITLLNSSGVVIASTTYSYRGGIKYKDWFKQAKSGKVSVSPVIAVLEPFRVVLVTAAPVLNHEGNITGVIAGQINMQRIWEGTDRIKLSNTGFVFLTDERGNIIAHPNKEKLFEKYGSQDFRKEFLSTAGGTINFSDNGVKKLCYFKILSGHKQYPGQDWRLGIVQESQDAFGIINQIKLQILFVGVGGFLFIILFSSFLSSHIVKPIKSLVRETEKVIKGDLDAHASVNSKDEIGGLGEAFNRMTHNLKTSKDEIERRTTELYQSNKDLQKEVKERKELEAQLLQSQKMEAIGRLAGGIAHDFNNNLTVILGYCDLLSQNTSPENPMNKEIKEIEKAGKRSADLTQQLLAFSRHQIILPQLLNVNNLILSMEKMLSRLIGEHIELVTHIEEKTDQVKIDPAQFEHILVNLAINARDAMPSGGKLIIKTKNIFLDKEYTKRHMGTTQGHYVMISIQDTGIGIEKNILSNIFEPFFTTKEIGSGTGLGLATVYGVIKQNQGHIDVYSEVGHGSVFNIYLPSIQTTTAALPKSVKKEIVASSGKETILFVEDDPSVRYLVVSQLKRLEYHVLVANNGVEALKRLKEEPSDKFDLLLTDIIMPEMGGKELAQKTRSFLPKIPILFISGYTEEAISKDPDFPLQDFLQKPFPLELLASKLRNLLDKTS